MTNQTEQGAAGRFTKKPVTIDAWQVPPDDGQTRQLPPMWLISAIACRPPTVEAVAGGGLNIKTLEGVMRADVGDWIIQGVKGELYPCKPDIFAATYEPAATVPTSEGYTSVGWTDVAQSLPEPQKPVLLDIGLKYPIRAMWVAAKTLPVGGGDDDDFGEYVEDDDEWYCPEGWYEWNQYENRHWSVGAKPLRWMPLPTTIGDKP